MKRPPGQPHSECSGWQRSANLTLASSETLQKDQTNTIPKSHAIWINSFYILVQGINARQTTDNFRCRKIIYSFSAPGQDSLILLIILMTANLSSWIFSLTGDTLWFCFSADTSMTFSLFQFPAGFQSCLKNGQTGSDHRAVQPSIRCGCWPQPGQDTQPGQVYSDT